MKPLPACAWEKGTQLQLDRGCGVGFGWCVACSSHATMPDSPCSVCPVDCVLTAQALPHYRVQALGGKEKQHKKLGEWEWPAAVVPSEHQQAPRACLGTGNKCDLQVGFMAPSS